VHFSGVIVGDQRIETRNKHVSSKLELVLVFEQGLLRDVLLNDVSALADALAAQLASLVETVEVVVLEEAQLDLFLGDDVLPDEVDLGLQQIAERGVVYEVEVVLALLLHVEAIGVRVEVRVDLDVVVCGLVVSA
jgi:hypothetical protein